MVTTGRGTVAGDLGEQERFCAAAWPQREAVILRYLLDLSVEQTAELLGKRPGAVRALTHRAITRLRPVLDVTGEVTEEADDVS